MKGLLYRDWALIKKTKTIYFGLFYLFFLIPDQNNSFLMNYSSNFLFIFIAYMFFSYLTAYDYKYNGLAFTSAFPVSKKDIVFSRYVFIVVAFVVYLVFLIIVKTFICLLQGMGLAMDFQQTGFFILIFSVFFSIIIPLYYKLGYQNMRWIMFIAMFLSSIISGILQNSSLNLNNLLFLVTTVIISGIIYRLSAGISCKLLIQQDL